MGNQCCSNQQYQTYEELLAKPDQVSTTQLTGQHLQLPSIVKEIVTNLKIIETPLNYNPQEPKEFPNGAIYEGEWKNGLRDGFGRQLWRDGSYYEGYFKLTVLEDLSMPMEMFTKVNGKMIKVYKNYKANGQGKYMHVDGAQYDGEWNDDLQNGQGFEIWPDGTSYQGEYQEGKKHGQGYFKMSDKSEYKGQFQNNMMEGQGTCIWQDGKQYIGEWKQNLMHGNGVYTWVDGKRQNMYNSYVGEYQNDQKHGFGEFCWPDGRKYRVYFQKKGQWALGQQHGKGIYKGAGKQEQEGLWENGKRVKWILDS